MGKVRLVVDDQTILFLSDGLKLVVDGRERDPGIAYFNDYVDGVEFLGNESQALGHVAWEPVDDLVIDKGLSNI